MSSNTLPQSAQKAVIYARVSGVKQTTQGDGLNSQISRCREFAGYKGYAVQDVFTDDITGKLFERPGMIAMLAYLKKRPGTVVLIDDISRLARGLEAHLRLRASLNDVGAILESPSIEFGDDPDSHLIENLLASVSQHQREKNAEQTKNRMRGRLLNGYWVFQPPRGYKFKRVKEHGKLLVPDEPVASIVKEALEGFASARFESQAEVIRFLESKPDFPKMHSKVWTSPVTGMLQQSIYAGYIEHPAWNVTRRKGHHKPLISFETFMTIQERIHGRKPKAARVDLNEDFPLRGFVDCRSCGYPMTAAWAQGKTKRYAYYFCKQKNCCESRKSIPKATIEDAFETMLKHLLPTKKLVVVMHDMLHDMWEARMASSTDDRKALKRQLKSVEAEISAVADRLVTTNSAPVVSAYERKIEALEADRFKIIEQLESDQTPMKTFSELFERAVQFLSNPWNIWENGDLTDRRMLLKLTFSKSLEYCREKGYRTPELSLPFKVLGAFCDPKKDMVPAAGVEPAT